jgi:hypothetical protein
MKMNNLLLLFALTLRIVLSATLSEGILQTNPCFTPHSGVVYITSYHARWYDMMLERNEIYGLHFNGTVLEHFPKGNLVIYHEEDVPAIEGACMFDLRKIEWLQDELADPNSGLNQYYSLAECTDPIWVPKIGDVKNGHALFIKVVSIYHATHYSPQGNIVFWLDTDVTFRETLPSHIIDWMRKRDIVYNPFVINYPVLTGGMSSDAFDLFNLSTREGQNQALLQEFWRIESGLFAFTVNEKTKVILINIPSIV